MEVLSDIINMDLYISLPNSYSANGSASNRDFIYIFVPRILEPSVECCFGPRKLECTVPTSLPMAHGTSNHYYVAKMAKLKLSSSSPNIFILSDRTEFNPYKNRNERSRCTVCLIVIFTFAIGLMMRHQCSDSMMQRTDHYDVKISLKFKTIQDEI
jgi:hypothetical protein